MKYVKLWYMYRDYSNYKRHNSIVFSNPQDLSLEAIDAAIRQCLIDGEWFLHNEWRVPDMHFEETVWKDDHPLHEYHFIEAVEQGEENVESISDFISRISQLSTKFPIFR